MEPVRFVEVEVADGTCFRETQAPDSIPDANNFDFDILLEAFTVDLPIVSCPRGFPEGRSVRIGLEGLIHIVEIIHEACFQKAGVADQTCKCTGGICTS